MARALWRPRPDFATGLAGWILAGGAHHTGYAPSLTSEHLEDFAEMAGIEFVAYQETRAPFEPSAKVVSGYERGEVGMPSYAGVLTDREIESIILFIKSLKD